MAWYVDYWKPEDSDNSPVRKDFLKMLRSNKAAQTQALKLIEGAEEFGPLGYKMPNNENLKDGLFELRDTVNHYRYYYCETDFYYDVDDERKRVLLLLLAEANKDRQQSHIKKAKERMTTISEDNLLNLEGYELAESEEEED